MAGKFSLFRFTKPGKGIKKADVPQETPTGLIDCFRLLGRNFWDLASLNLLYIVINFPVFFGLFALTGNLDLKTYGPSSNLFAPLYGMMLHRESPATSVLYGMLGGNARVLVPTTLTRIFFALPLLVLFTFGFANTGMTYVLRGYVRREPVSVLSDFLYAMKKNIKQSLVSGILDLVIIAVLAQDIVFWKSAGGFVGDMLFFASLFLCLLYFLMRFYLYLMLITFDLPIRKLLKNALIFAFLGFQRNMAATLGIAAVTLLNLYLILVLPFFGMIVPFILTFSITAFFAAYAAYPVIKRVMIDPYEQGNPPDKPHDTEPIFTDRG